MCLYTLYTFVISQQNFLNLNTSHLIITILWALKIWHQKLYNAKYTFFSNNEQLIKLNLIKIILIYYYFMLLYILLYAYIMSEQ